jgi:serine O-acetyltransferase
MTADPIPEQAQPPPASILRGSQDQNPRGIGVLAVIAEDFRTHGKRWGAPGFWAVALHRFGNWRMRVKGPLRAPLTIVYRTAYQAIRWGWGIELPYDVKLGRRVYLEHHGSLNLGARSIGDDVVFRRAAAVGVVRGGAPDDDKPVIEDRVEIGPRACVVGPITVGHDSLVCANSIVAVSVPPHSTVLGVPGRLVDREMVEPGGKRPGR